MYICVYVYISVEILLLIQCIYIEFNRIFTCIYIYIYIYIHIWTYMQYHTNVYLYIYLYIYINMYIWHMFEHCYYHWIQLQRTTAISKRFVVALDKDGCCSTSGAEGPEKHLMYIHIYIYMICSCIHMYIYIHIHYTQHIGF
jgi:hypothetical protein